MEILRRTEDPVAVEIIRRCSSRSAEEPSTMGAAAFYLPGDCNIPIGGSGGLCTTSGSELSCYCTCPPARHPSSCCSRSVGVQTALNATEMIASAAIIAASRAAEEARIALGIPLVDGYHHRPMSLRDSMTVDQLAKNVGEHVKVDDGDGDDDDEDGEQVEGDGDGDVDEDEEEEEVLFGGPAFLTHCQAPTTDPLSEVNQLESTYANFPDFPERNTGLGSEFSTSSKPESNSCDTQDGHTPELSEILGGAPLEWTYFVSSAEVFNQSGDRIVTRICYMLSRG
ncbi:unnamed protein product [Dibothriocephalus latus]|uniref:Uncharacterized protein n=1 Tax=Dibothriocephalus latus TaxID=60516 RepID=A0A3P6S759_DIBLA|nr:unnamed protein product [Dibothriocephalus latus]